MPNPPTLPVVAVLDGFEQPIFSIDSETGALNIDGYVDRGSEACTFALAKETAPSSRYDISRFRKRMGSHLANANQAAAYWSTAKPIFTNMSGK